MLHDGPHLRRAESASGGVIIHSFKLLHQERTTFNPSVECFHGRLAGRLRTIEQSQVGLGIRTDFKHGYGILDRHTNIQTNPYIYKFYTRKIVIFADIARHIGTFADTAGQSRTLRSRDVVSLQCQIITINYQFSIIN